MNIGMFLSNNRDPDTELDAWLPAPGKRTSHPVFD